MATSVRLEDPRIADCIFLTPPAWLVVVLGTGVENTQGNSKNLIHNYVNLYCISLFLKSSLL